jgi:hypothetical protein
LSYHGSKPSQLLATTEFLEQCPTYSSIRSYAPNLTPKIFRAILWDTQYLVGLIVSRTL